MFKWYRSYCCRVGDRFGDIVWRLLPSLSCRCWQIPAHAGTFACWSHATIRLTCPPTANVFSVNQWQNGERTINIRPISIGDNERHPNPTRDDYTERDRTKPVVFSRRCSVFYMAGLLRRMWSVLSQLSILEKSTVISVTPAPAVAACRFANIFPRCH